MEKGKDPIWPKGRGKGIMISAFLTPGGLLQVSTKIIDAQLLQNLMWP